MGNSKGIAKFFIDSRSELLLGAVIYGVDSQELINTSALAIREKIPAERLGSGIYTHPATFELFNALLA